MSGPEELVQYYCDGCTSLLYAAPGRGFCTRCNRELGGPSRMESHQRESVRKQEAYEASQRAASKGAIETLKELELTDDMLEKQGECGICEQQFEVGIMVKAMNCGHFFHGHCIVEQLESKNKCPICGCSLFESVPAKKWWDSSSSGSSSRA